MSITIVGLGPGNGELITRQAWEVLSSTELLYVRTEQHPTVADLPTGIKIRGFDHLYETANNFADVYSQIIQDLLRIGKSESLVYAVPGHPNIGESTVTSLVKLADKEGIACQIIPGLSFVEPVLTAVGADALDGLQVYDALAVAGRLYPPCRPNTALLIGQVYNQLVTSDVKLVLASVFPEEHLVTLVHNAGNSNETIESLPLYAIDRSKHINHLTTLFVPPLNQPSSLSDLANTVAVLRSPAGCPWDQEQTPQSMRDGFLEEAYEVLEALDAEDKENLEEELGDLLYHLVMQAQMAYETGDFTLSDVLAGIDAKLKRRHPHVWGDVDVNNSAEVLENWELIKKAEKTENSQSILDGLSISLPALTRSQKIQRRVGSIGFDWPDIEGVFEKIQEEIEEIKDASTPEGVTAEIGDLLFATVNLARWLDVDAESSLREANLRFSRRFKIVEDIANLNKINLSDQSLEELEWLWAKAKEKLAKGGTDAKV